MGRGHRQSEGWHRRIDAAAAGHHPVGPGAVPNQIFPWVQLQGHTDLYLQKKGKITPQERDTRLLALINKHTTKDVALAACAHAMSPEAVRILLSGNLNVEPGSYHGLLPYLQLIVAVNYVNQNAINELEAQRAQALHSFSHFSETLAGGRYLKAVMTLWMTGIPPNSLLHSHVNALASTACARFVVQLETLRNESQWSRAQAAASWLSTFSERSCELSPEKLAPELLLDVEFPAWRTWAAWRPNGNRLKLWERIPNEQRGALEYLLALEGPDFSVSSGTYSTLREGLLAQGSIMALSTIRYGNLQVKVDDGDSNGIRCMLNRLLEMIDALCRTGVNAIELVTYLCIGKRIDQETVRVLDTAISMADASISASVLQLYKAHDELGHVEMTAVMQLLPLLAGPNGQTLRECLAPYLTERISNCMEEMQIQLRTDVQAGRSWALGEMKQTHAFGVGLQKATWLRPLLDAPLRALISNWPTLEDIRALNTLRIASFKSIANLRNAATALTVKVDSYCMHRLVRQGSVDEPTTRLVEALVGLWQKTPDSGRRALALKIAQGGSGANFHCRCLAQIPIMPDDFVHTLRVIITQAYGRDVDTVCVDLARLLASATLPDVVECWKQVHHHLIKQRGAALIDYTVNHLTAKEWLQWLVDLDTLYGDRIVSWDPVSSPAILQPSLYTWVHRLPIHLPAITRLEKGLGCSPAIQCLLTGVGMGTDDVLIQILDLLKRRGDERYQPAIQVVVGRLRRDGSNATEVFESLSTVTNMSADGAEACARLLELQERASPQVAEVMLAVRLQDSELSGTDHHALRIVTGSLGLTLDGNGDPPAESLDIAASYLDDQFAAVIAEAQRLDDLRLDLKAVNPDKISRLLISLGVENPSIIDDAIASLPTELVDVVERVNDQEIELHFPLTHLSALQRAAIGAGKAQSLLVRLLLSDSGIPPGFCMHLDDEPKSAGIVGGHFPWIVLDKTNLPETPFCHGRANRTTYQLARTLSRHLIDGFQSLEKVHTLLANALKDMAQSCMICGTSHGARLRRPTFCQASGCLETLLRASDEILLTDLRADPEVVDLLLTMVYAVAVSCQSNPVQFDLLLPGCPLVDAAQILQVLESLPAIATFQHAGDLSKALMTGVHTNASMLIAWVCNTYRGFLASAKSGNLRIPGMPGAHQFVLANAAPELESAFAERRGQTPSRLLFHGTTLDRIHSILCRGLLVCSGGPLQRHGASRGRGIYMAEHPATSWGYSNRSTTVFGSAHSGWRNSAFHNVNVVLGCELAGNGNPIGGGVHVITDESTVMVRYIFLVPPMSAAPITAHISPAMLSAFASLRSGAV